MHIFVRHATTYNFETPARAITQLLRLTPRPFFGQHVHDWRIDTDIDCRLRWTEDSFGNLIHSFTATGEIDTFTVIAEGHVMTEDKAGVVQGAIERLPSALYRRSTPQTEPDAGILEIAKDTFSGRVPLEAMHALNVHLKETMRFDTGATQSTTTAKEAFAAGHGVCQDFAHILLAAARSQGLPARYVSGYLVDGAETPQCNEAAHAWMEAEIPELGWVAFDPAHGISADDRYVRVSIGLDALSAAPVRGVQRGGSGETLDVSVMTYDADRNATPATQSQRQRQ